MTELDFYTFGAPRNMEFLGRIKSILDDLDAKDLYLRSAEFYYGSKEKAAKMLYGPSACPLGEEPYIIADGESMLLEMSDAERAAFLSSDKPRIRPRIYIKMVERWRAGLGVEFESGYANEHLPVAAALKFIRFYYGVRKISDAVRNFFQCTGFKNQVKAASAVRAEIEARADSSAICAAAMDIFREYETFIFNWEKSREHMTLQRAIMRRQRKKFYLAVAARDGECCAKCKTTGKLELDHIKPVLFGGVSELDNLQLLCAKCNNKKRWVTEDYRDEKAATTHVAADS